MRILTVGNMYPPHHLGGYELLWQAAVRELRERGHDVLVLTSDHREPGAGPEEDEGVHRDLRWYWRDHDFPRLGPRARVALERHNAQAWRRHVRRFAPEVVSWWAMGGMSTSLIERARLDGLPASGWVIDDWLIYGPDVDQWTRPWRRSRRLARAGAAATRLPTRVDYARAGRWVFCSESVLRFARGKRPWLAEADTVVESLGVAPEFTAHPEQDWAWRLVYAGRLDERKGIDVALRALAELPQQATLRVVGGGDPSEAARLRRLAADLGVAERVAFEAPVPRAELGGVYASGDVTLFPVTWFEPFGLVPLEAMAVGRPVLATGRGGSGDYLRDGENTLLHPPGDHAALAATVRRLAEEPALRGRLREGGFRTAAELTEARWLDAVVREHERLVRT